MTSKPKMWEKLTPSDVRRLQKKLPGKRKEFEAGFVELEPPDPSEGAYSEEGDHKKQIMSEKTTFVQWLLYVYDGHNGHIRKLVRDLESSTDRPTEEDYFTIYTWLKKKKKADPFILEACELAHQIFDQSLRDPSSFSPSSSSSSSAVPSTQSLMDTKHTKEDQTPPKKAKEDKTTIKMNPPTTTEDIKDDKTAKEDKKDEVKQKDVYTIQSFVIPTDLTKTNYDWLSTLVLSDFMMVAQDTNNKKKFIDFHKWLSALALGPQDWSLTSDTKSDGRHHVVVRLKNYNLYCDQTGQKSHLYRFKIENVKEWSLASFEQLMKETGTKFFHSSSDKGIQWPSTIVSTKFVSEWAKHQQTKFAPTGQEPALNQPVRPESIGFLEKPTLRMEDVDLPFVIDLASDWSQHPKYKQNLLKPNQSSIVGFARYGVSTNQVLKFTAAIEKMGYQISKLY